VTVENSLSAPKVLEETVVLTNFTALTPLLTLLATFVFADQCQACDKQMKNQQIKEKEKMPSESLR